MISPAPKAAVDSSIRRLNTLFPFLSLIMSSFFSWCANLEARYLQSLAYALSGRMALQIVSLKTTIRFICHTTGTVKGTLTGIG